MILSRIQSDYERILGSVLRLYGDSIDEPQGLRFRASRVRGLGPSGS